MGPKNKSQFTTDGHRLTKSGRIDARAFNGGARKGAGRPISKQRQAWIDFAMETVVVKEFRHGQVRRVKKTRLQVALDKLFHIAIYGGKKGQGNVRACSLYLDYTLGKVPSSRAPKKKKSRYSYNGGQKVFPTLKDHFHAQELEASSFDAHLQQIDGEFFPKPPPPPPKLE